MVGRRAAGPAPPTGNGAAGRAAGSLWVTGASPRRHGTADIAPSTTTHHAKLRVQRRAGRGGRPGL